jgi:uncharacterized oxidoreductase
LALAKKLHTKGNKVIIGGGRADRLEQIVAENPDFDAVELDTADADSIAGAQDAGPSVRHSGRSSRGI